MVLWHDHQAGEWRCALNRCPHRFAQLSEGRVDGEGRIECPYHGWAFEGSQGACQQLPQLEPGAKLDNERARVLVLPVRERQGLLWVWAAALVGSTADPDEAALERLLIPQLTLPGVTVLNYSRDLPMDATIICENVMDPSHLPFTHDGTISRRSAASTVPLKLRGAAASSGFFADRDTTPPGSVEFRAPHCVVSETRRDGSFRDWNIVYAVPQGPGRSRVFVRVAFEVGAMEGLQKLGFSTLFGLPSWILHQNNHRILEDDNIFLHHQDLALRAAAWHEEAQDSRSRRIQPRAWQRQLFLPSGADVTVSAYRNWLERHTAGKGPAWSLYAPPFEPPRPRSRVALLDRLEAHTAHCSCCRAARHRAESASPWAAAAAFTSLAAGAGTFVAGDSSAAGGLLIVGLLAGGAFALCRGVLESTSQGRYPPPRNRR